MAEFTTVLTCGHCNRDAHMWMTELQSGVRTTFVDAKGLEKTAYAVANPGSKKVAWGGCTLCARVTVLVFSKPNRENGEQTEVLTEIEQYPPSKKIPAPTTWPEKLRTAWEDVTKVQAAGASPATVATCVGTCLELAFRELSAKGPNFKEKIDDLRTKNIITSGMANWAHKLRGWRNAGTHEFSGSADDVDESVEFLRLFLQLTFTLRLEIESKAGVTDQTIGP